MRIEGLRKYQRRRRKGSHFEYLPPEVRPVARMWLEKFIAKRRAFGLPVPSWLKGILYGQAKRLALKPCGREWGRRMRAIKAGRAAQRRYRLEGRNPTAIATRVRLARGEARSRATGEGGTRTPDRPPFALNPNIIAGSSRDCRTPQDLAKQIAERVAYVLSSDDRFSVNSPRPARWEWEVWLAPVP